MIRDVLIILAICTALRLTDDSVGRTPDGQRPIVITATLVLGLGLIGLLTLDVVAHARHLSLPADAILWFL